MKIGNSSQCVEFEVEDNGSDYDQSYLIRVSREGYNGVTRSVYISTDDARNFISQLELIEKNLAESAKLINASSESDASPLDLKIRRADSLGHLVVEATTRKWVMNVGVSSFLSTSISFELDRELLAATIRDFKRLLLR